MSFDFIQPAFVEKKPYVQPKQSPLNRIKVQSSQSFAFQETGVSLKFADPTIKFADPLFAKTFIPHAKLKGFKRKATNEDLHYKFIKNI